MAGGDGDADAQAAPAASRPLRPRAPRHAMRATRSAGQRMRSRLLDAASALFKTQGLNGISITAIAGAADAFPSQVTYYFRTKEALFVEAACRDMLHIAERAEKAAARARSPKAYVSALVENVMRADGLALFLEALVLTRQRPDLVPQVSRTIERLHVEGARAYAGEMTRHGWRSRRPADASARRFWTIALGVALEGHATGRSAAAMAAAMLDALGAMTDAGTAAGSKPTLRLVETENRALATPKRGSP
jgi:AcrR family transcriptional regulator